jgi:hypothetical protein
MVFTAAAPLSVSGIRPTARLSAGGLWRCSGALPAAYTTCNFWLPDGVVSHACNTTSVLEVNGSAGRSVAGTLVDYDDGRQALVFMNDVSGGAAGQGTSYSTAVCITMSVSCQRCCCT